MLRVSTAVPDDRASALSLLFRQSADSERDAQVAEMLAAADRGEISLDGLLTARDGGQIQAAGLYVEQADKVAFVWPVRVRDDCEQVSVTDAVFRELCRRIDRADVWLGQCILEPAAKSDREALTRNGFAHLADLVYLHRPLNVDFPSPPEIGFQTVCYEPSTNRERFVRVVEKTYVGTLDCPEFHQFRTASKAFDAHRFSGEFDPGRWKLYSVNDIDVGVLLMNDHPPQDAWELVYVGVVPEARGKGYARTMLLDGLTEAHRAGRASVLLAVDRNNVYANSVYSDLGFLELASRSVHIRVCQKLSVT